MRVSDGRNYFGPPYKGDGYGVSTRSDTDASVSTDC